MSNHNIQKINLKSGFSLVEMLIVAPIVILMIGVFVSAIVSMTGDVLSTRGSNALAYNVQDALGRIATDIKLSGGLLATNNIPLSAPQGYNNDTTTFHNSSATTGTMLILNSYATTNNPLSTTQSLLYMSDQPNACNSPQVNQNPPVMLNIVYFVKNNTLWRRVIVPANYATVGCTGGSIGAPWQQPSCYPGISGTICKTQDQRLVDGIATNGFSISYYSSPNSIIPNSIASDDDHTKSNSVRQAALQTTSTVSVTIDAKNTIAGRDISQSGSIREISPNNITPSAFSSCSAILNAGSSTGNGIYSIDPDGNGLSNAFQVYCDMTNQNGGWTLALDLQTSDGVTRHYYDTDFWTGTAQYGSVSAPFANDYKSTAFSKMPATEIMMLANNDGVVMGSAKYSLVGSAINKTLYWMFNNLSNTTITGNRTGNSGSVGSNGRLRNDGESFIDHTYPIIINSTYQPLDATNETRLGTNYAASCGVINCNGHNYGGWGGRHYRGGWGDYYEGSAINGYCSTQGGFGTNGSAYNGNNAFDGNTTGCGASTTALHNVDMAVFIR